MTDHRDLSLLAAGAALDDLDPAERVTFDAHAQTCSDCRSLGTQLGSALADLAFLLPDVQPPPGLQDRILASLREPALLVAGPALRPAFVGGTSMPDGRTHDPVEAAPRSGTPWRTRAIAGFGLAAVLAIAVATIGVRTVELDGRIGALREVVAQAQTEAATRDAAMAVIAAPDHRSAVLHAEAAAPDAVATVVFRAGTSQAYLVASGLPATPASEVYQLWFADAAGVHPLGTFRHDGQGTVVAAFGIDLTTSVAAMVTLEPVGGATGEPGPQVIFGEW